MSRLRHGSARRAGAPATAHATRTATALLVVAALGFAGCDARDSGEADSGSGAAVLDANGNVVSGNADGVPALGGAAELPPVPTFQLFSDETDLETGGADTAVITATLIDEDRNPVVGETLSWRADGGVLQDVVATTDDNGTATAALRMPQSFRNVDVTVIVTAGTGASTSEQAITVRAYGTELDVQGLQKSVVAGEELEAIMTLTAGDGEPIPNRVVSVTSAVGNTIDPAEPVTDENGVAAVRIGSALGSDVIVVDALDDPSLRRSFEFAVSADRLEFPSADASTFDVDTLGRVRVRWTSGGAPVAFQDLRVSTTAGRITSASTLTTGVDGYITVPLSSSAAGQATITVEALDGDPVSDFPVTFVATAPALLDVGATSTRVYVDGSSQVGALVRDVNGNPVAGREVAFASPNLNGGQLSPASAVTNEEGRATTTFRAGSIATEIDAIEITAVTAGASALVDTVRLSVVERRLNVTVGRGAGLFEDGLKTQNWKNMVVQVADGSGAPLAEADVTVSITPISYAKGRMTVVDSDGYPRPSTGAGSTAEERALATGWSAARYAVHDAWHCDAEDAGSLNRSLDPGEDVNGNGRLDPQDPAVLSPIGDATDIATLDANGTLVTADDGSGYFRMVYPKGNANWVQVRVTARASHLGTEAQDSLVTTLPSMIEDVAYAGGTPPNYLSPYGQARDCAVPD